MNQKAQLGGEKESCGENSALGMEARWENGTAWEPERGKNFFFSSLLYDLASILQK